MPDTIDPEKAVDALAYTASLVTGIRAVYGCGASGITFPTAIYDDPAHPNVVRPIPNKMPLEPLTVSVELPTAPRVRHASGTVAEIDWQIPMRLWLAGNSQMEARRQAAPFYGRFLTTFSQYGTLGGHANSCLIQSFALGGDGDSVWLDMVCSVWQRANLDNQPGPSW